jgi:hypothetical protein
LRLAHSDDEVRTKINIELLLEIRFHVDLGEHPIIMSLECFFFVDIAASLKLMSTVFVK